MHVSQAAVSAVVAEGEFGVIDAKKVQRKGIERKIA
jgi:hypothetical protein